MNLLWNNILSVEIESSYNTYIDAAENQEIWNQFIHLEKSLTSHWKCSEFVYFIFMPTWISLAKMFFKIISLFFVFFGLVFWGVCVKSQTKNTINEA